MMSYFEFILICRKMNGHRIHRAVCVCAALLSASAWAKPVEIDWNAIDDATGYEIQLSRNGKIIEQKKIKDTHWEGDLPFGLYSYQIRAYDKVDRAGLFSALKPLVVQAPTLELTSPESGDSMKTYSNENAVKLKWKPIAGISEYKVTIESGDTVVFNKTVSDTELEVKKMTEGDYRWQVRAVISGFSKKWEAEPSNKRKFSIIHENLDSPDPRFPTGTIPPQPGSKIKFEWKPVIAAQKYFLDITFEKTNKTAHFSSTLPYFTLPLAEEGRYSWKIRAQRDDTSSKTEEANFELNRNALFTNKQGYVAFSTMLAPYDYKVVSPSSGYVGQVSSIGMTMRASAEYWNWARLGFSGAYEDTRFQINHGTYNRNAYELLAKTQIAASNDRMGWFLSPKAGLESRKYIHLTPRSGKTLQEEDVNAKGITLGIDLRKPITERWSLGIKSSYFIPLSASHSEVPLTLKGHSNYRNISLGTQMLYWWRPTVGLAMGAYVEKRSLGVISTSTKLNAAEEVYMDGVYFFGSLIWRFGSK